MVAIKLRWSIEVIHHEHVDDVVKVVPWIFESLSQAASNWPSADRIPRRQPSASVLESGKVGPDAITAGLSPTDDDRY